MPENLTSNPLVRWLPRLEWTGHCQPWHILWSGKFLCGAPKFSTRMPHKMQAVWAQCPACEQHRVGTWQGSAET